MSMASLGTRLPRLRAQLFVSCAFHQLAGEEEAAGCVKRQANGGCDARKAEHDLRKGEWKTVSFSPASARAYDVGVNRS